MTRDKLINLIYKCGILELKQDVSKMGDTDATGKLSINENIE